MYSPACISATAMAYNAHSQMPNAQNSYSSQLIRHSSNTRNDIIRDTWPGTLVFRILREAGNRRTLLLVCWQLFDCSTSDDSLPDEQTGKVPADQMKEGIIQQSCSNGTATALLQTKIQQQACTSVANCTQRIQRHTRDLPMDTPATRSASEEGTQL